MRKPGLPLLFVTATLLLLAATNKWMGWAEGMHYVQADDLLNYEPMALAAPGLTEKKIAHHHGQRLFSHYVIGSTAKLLGVAHEGVYRAFWLAMTLGLSALVWFLVARLVDDRFSRALCFSVFAFNPYTLRYYALVPGMMQDLLFMTGSAVLFAGLLKRSTYLVLLGFLAAYLGRQTAFTLLPGAVVWLVAEKRHREAAASTVLLVVVHLLTGIVAHKLAAGERSANVDHIVGIAAWARDSFSVAGLGEHTLRVFFPYAMVLAVLGALALRLKKLPRFSARFWGAVLMVAGMIAQPFLAGPMITRQNGARLSSLGMVGASVLLALALRESKAKLRPGLPAMVCVGALVFAGSLHHLYAAIGPSTTAQFTVFHLALACALGGACYWHVFAKKSP